MKLDIKVPWTFLLIIVSIAMSMRPLLEKYNEAAA